MDRELLQEAARLILRAASAERRPGLEKTPERFASYFSENGDTSDLKAFLTGAIIEERFGGMVVEEDLFFCSLCEHHLLPFFGTAKIGYIPDGKIVGLSKLPRLLRAVAEGPNLQERIAQQVIDTIEEVLKPAGVGIVLTATHLCMIARGVQAERSTTTTSIFTGLLKTDAEERRTFFASKGN